MKLPSGCTARVRHRRCSSGRGTARSPARLRCRPRAPPRHVAADRRGFADLHLRGVALRSLPSCACRACGRRDAGARGRECRSRGLRARRAIELRTARLSCDVGSVLAANRRRCRERSGSHRFMATARSMRADRPVSPCLLGTELHVSRRRLHACAWRANASAPRRARGGCAASWSLHVESLREVPRRSLPVTITRPGANVFPVSSSVWSDDPPAPDAHATSCPLSCAAARHR